MKVTKMANRTLHRRHLAWIAAGLLCLTLACPLAAQIQCKAAIGTWQSQQILKNRLALQGWQIQRIRVIAGCYEVKAVDQVGRTVKALFAPATLSLLELEIQHAGPRTPLAESLVEG